MLHEVIYIGEKATMECYIHESSPEMSERNLRPAVLVVPGGGYGYVSDREGEPVASSFFARGFHAFVLHYAVGVDAKNNRPFIDIAKAIVMLRQKASEWGIDAKKIAVCGFSAGGHLAAASGILSNQKEILQEVRCEEGENTPNAIILGYPVISSGRFAHRSSFENLGSVQEGDAIAQRYSLEKHVTADMPPLFVWHTVEDVSVPVENTLLLIEALRKNKVSFEAHFFEKGAHGGSMGNAEVGRAGSSCAPWFDMAVHWLARHFSFAI